MKEIKYRYYCPGDEEKIVNLLNLVFRGWPRSDINCPSIDYWRWKYEENPFQEYTVALCEYNDQIIGCNHTVPIKVKVGNNILLCGYSADLAVHPDFRKMGISGDLINLNSKLRSNAGMSFDIAATRNPLLIKSRARARAMDEFPIQINHLARLRNIRLHLEKIHSKNMWAKELGLRSLIILHRLSTLLKRPESKKVNYRISDIVVFDNRIEDLWNKIKDNYSFILERSIEYLNWRYCDERGGKYHIKIAEDDEMLLGYMVLRINKFQNDYPRGFIVDLLTLPNHQDVAEALVQNAIQYFDQNNVNMINSWVVKKHPYEQLLSRYGFINIGLRPYIYYEPILLNLQEMIGDELPSRINFVYGNMDWI